MDFVVEWCLCKNLNVFFTALIELFVENSKFYITSPSVVGGTLQIFLPIIY